MIQKTVSALKSGSVSAILTALRKTGFFYSDEIFIKMLYRLYIGRSLDLDNPETFSAKLQWLKLNDRRPEYSSYVDKYEVRKHVARIIGEQYLIPLIGIYDSADEIKWDRLPDRFVLKATHTSGDVIICLNKATLDIGATKRTLNKWLKRNYYFVGREWPYKNIKPRIICEQYISDTGSTPDDYKFMCFNGDPKLIQLHQNRYKNYTQDYYDISWRKTGIAKKDVPNSKTIAKKPSNFKEMLEIARKLSKGLRFARIDLYSVGGKTYFGEITYYPAAGFPAFEKIEDDYLLGSYIGLN